MPRRSLTPMTPKAKSTALVLSGAVALSFTAYAIGSQTGSGSADAQSASAKSSSSSTATPPGRLPPRRLRRPDGERPASGPALDDLAAKLGVSTSALQKAFEDARQSLPRPAERRDEHLEGARGRARRDRGQAARRASARVKPERGERHDELAAALAKELGVSAAKVKRRVRQAPRAGPPRPRRPRGPQGRPREGDRRLRGQARAGLPHLREDFRERARRSAATSTPPTSPRRSASRRPRSTPRSRSCAPRHEAEHEKMRDALAASLAKSLKLDEAKVKAALEDFAPERGGHRHP